MSNEKFPPAPRVPLWVKVLAIVGLGLVLMLALLHGRHHFRHLAGFSHSAAPTPEAAP